MNTPGLTQAARALHYWERRQEIVANNLANSETSGFKAERVFARLLGEAAGPVADTATDLRSGTLRATGNPLDLALEGEGFFVVNTEQGERLTRGGAFRLDEQGQIVDANGNALLGDGGPLTTTSSGSIVIDSAGKVTVDGSEVGTIRVVNIPDGADLQHLGGNLFSTDAQLEPMEADPRLVRQGHVEESNVNTVGSLVDMISIQRSYAAVQRAVTTLDEIRGTASNEIGKPI